MPKSDVEFSFNELPFVKGVKAASKALGSMQSRAKDVSQGIVNSVGKVVGKLAVLKIAFESIKSVLNEIPEIGQAFEIAKDIFFKNFLFPLRQFLLPILQDVLDWVRDNRSQFVKWGQIVANAFRVVFQFAQQFWNVLETVFGLIQKVLTGIFGLPPNFEDAINVILFKLAAIASFVGELLEPVFQTLSEAFDKLNPFFESIKNIVSGLLQIAEAFGEGFLSGLDLDKIVNSFNSIGESISRIIFGEDGKSGLQAWQSIFERLGRVVSTTVVSAFMVLEGVVKAIADIIDGIRAFFEDPGKAIQDLLGIQDSDVGDRTRDFETINERARERLRARGIDVPTPPAQAGTPGVDSLGTNLGRVNNVESSVNIDTINVSVTEGDAERAAENYISGIDIGIRNQFVSDQERFGG